MKRFLHRLALVGGILLALIVITNAIIYLSTRSYMYAGAKDAPNAQAAVIPGAAVLKNGALSPIFKDRVDAAIGLYRENKVSKILVSGDNSTVSYNEVNRSEEHTSELQSHVNLV